MHSTPEKLFFNSNPKSEKPTMRDNYMGFQIDYSSQRDGYRVMMENEVVKEFDSYDAACLWVENYQSRFVVQQSARR
jgi:hypothetical protein